MTGTTTPPRPPVDLRDGWKRRGLEWAMLPATLAELAALRADVKALGYGDQLANGLTGWLAAKASGQPTNTSPQTAATYRKILARVDRRRRRRVAYRAAS